VDRHGPRLSGDEEPMKRIAIVFVVLTVGLSALLYWKLREQRLELARPAGGSATIEGTEVDVTARLAARIRAVHAAEGEAVTAGQVLVELDCAEWEAALAQADAAVAGARTAIEGAQVGEALALRGVEAAERQVRAAAAATDAARAQARAAGVQRGAAQRAAKRLEQVGASGAASEQVLDRARSEAAGLAQQVQALTAGVEAAAAQAAAAVEAHESARERVRLAQVEAAGARRRLEAADAGRARAAAAVAECRILAPRGGVVQSRNFEPGEVALPGSRILTIVDTSEVEATFFLPNAELGAAAPGRPIEVVADAYPDRVVRGTIRRIATAAEFTPRNVQTREDRDRLVYAVTASIPNPDGTLRPGMPVEVRIPGTGAGTDGGTAGSVAADVGAGAEAGAAGAPR
jgi:HlyD family secretion protein